MNEDEALIFLHIPKTAGSTFHSVLGSRYNKNEIYNIFGSRYSDPEVKKFISLSDENKKNIRLFKGHMPFGLHKYLPRKCKYITVLRDPVERVISQYYYIKQNTFNPLHDEVVNNNLTIAELLESGISVGLNDGQCRFLNGDIDEYKYEKTDVGLLDKVKKNIEDNFIWVGVTERFDESVLLLSILLGWKKPPYYIRANVSRTRKAKKQIDQKDIDAILKRNQCDIGLLKYANDYMDYQISKINSFKEQLEAFKKKNKAIQKRWGWLPGKLRKYVV